MSITDKPSNFTYTDCHTSDKPMPVDEALEYADKNTGAGRRRQDHALKTLAAEVRRLQNASLEIGEFSIQRFDAESFFVQRLDGEGMQTPDAKLADMIERFFVENF